ncbi:MAG: hypothetical protein ACYC1W_05975 [Gemmatimonadaceae bacterium]
MDCEYRVGTSLHFTIAGVGQDDAGVTFHRVDWNQDFYPTFGIGHGCVVIKQGKARLERLAKMGDLSGLDMAFVSPRNGKVYDTWTECAEAR